MFCGEVCTVVLSAFDTHYCDIGCYSGEVVEGRSEWGGDGWEGHVEVETE